MKRIFRDGYTQVAASQASCTLINALGLARFLDVAVTVSVPVFWLCGVGTTLDSGMGHT